MEPTSALLIIALAAILLVVGYAIKRHQNKKMEESIRKSSSPEMEKWFIGWLASHRQEDPSSINNNTPINVDEARSALDDAKAHFGMFLLMGTDIKNVGQFVGMLHRQISPRINMRKTANAR